MTFRKILCPTDFSVDSFQAIRFGARLAGETAELVVAHAWTIPTSVYAGDPALPPNMIQGIVDDAQRGLDEAVRLASASGASRASGILVNGTPWAEVVAQLEKHAFDLCVVGTRGRTGLARVFLGSVAEKIVRHAPCSVLAVHSDAVVKPFSHVLVPIDFSDHAKIALELAAKVVEPTGKITLLHVIEVPVAYAGEVPNPDFGRELDRRASVALEKTAAALRNTTTATVEVHSRIGYPGAQTLDTIGADPSIDLVVMGSHGRTGIKRVLLGSVAEKVVRHAGRPVLVARRR